MTDWLFFQVKVYGFGYQGNELADYLAKEMAATKSI